MSGGLRSRDCLNEPPAKPRSMQLVHVVGSFGSAAVDSELPLSRCGGGWGPWALTAPPTAQARMRIGDGMDRLRQGWDRGLRTRRSCRDGSWTNAHAG